MREFNLTALIMSIVSILTIAAICGLAAAIFIWVAKTTMFEMGVLPW